MSLDKNFFTVLFSLIENVFLLQLQSVIQVSLCLVEFAFLFERKKKTSKLIKIRTL